MFGGTPTQWVSRLEAAASVLQHGSVAKHLRAGPGHPREEEFEAQRGGGVYPRMWGISPQLGGQVGPVQRRSDYPTSSRVPPRSSPAILDRVRAPVNERGVLLVASPLAKCWMISRSSSDNAASFGVTSRCPEGSAAQLDILEDVALGRPICFSSDWASSPFFSFAPLLSFPIMGTLTRLL